MPKYELFVMKGCPFCKKVLKFMEKSGIEIPVKDILDENQEKADENKKYLLEKGGKVQVPCLFIDEKPMYESSDIIEYMKENLAK